MTPFALAIWFCDDGHAEPDHNGGNIATLGFIVEDVQYLQDLLRRRFRIETTLQLRKDGRLLIILPPDARQRIINFIKPFKTPEMAYQCVDLPPPRRANTDSDRITNLSFAFASAAVCQCMFSGPSAPPRFRGTT